VGLGLFLLPFEFELVFFNLGHIFLSIFREGPLNDKTKMLLIKLGLLVHELESYHKSNHQFVPLEHSIAELLVHTASKTSI
jgi:hypothetical protein